MLKRCDVPNFVFMLCVLVLQLTVESPAQTSVSASHLSYRLIDLGTFGGPNSSEGVVFPFINDTGVVVGFSDTTTPDPLNPGAFIPHAFRWSKGVLTDLGTLPGGSGSFAVWSNNQGQVVGVSDDGHVDPVLGGPEGFATLWNKNGRVVNLGTFGGTQSLAGSINERGQVIGVAANTTPDMYSIFGWATETRGFIWEKGVMRELGTLGGTDTSPSFINDRGQVAGISYVDSTFSPQLCGLDNHFPIITHPFFWQEGTMLDIGTLGGSCGLAATINNRGQVAGTANLAGDQILHPFLWERGRIMDLGTLGGSFGWTNWMNDAGEVVGVASTEGDQEFHGFFWKNGVMHDIGTIQEDVCSIPHFVNARGQVVGTSGCTDVGFEVHGFIWQPNGSIIDLNDFVPPGSEFRVTDGETINDRGEIAGSGLLPNGDFHAIVLIPCDAEHGESDGCQDANQSRNKSSLSPTKTHVVGNMQKFDAHEVFRRVMHGNRRQYTGLPGN